MATAQELFASLIRLRIAPTLRDAGFRGSGSTFRTKRDGVWHVFNFQRSNASTRDEVRFTVNVSVASERLREPWWNEGAPPTEAHCALRTRLGFLLDDRPAADYWWIVDAGTDLDRLAADLTRYLVEVGIPFLRRFPNETALRDHWLATLDAGELSRTDFGQLVRLTEELGPPEVRVQLGEGSLREELERRWAAGRDAARRAVDRVLMEQEQRPEADRNLIRTPRARFRRVSR